MGTYRQRSRDEIYLFHLSSSRRFFHVRHPTIGLQRGQSYPFQTGHHQGTCRSLPETRAQTISLLFPYRLAPSGLLPMGTHGTKNGTYPLRHVGGLFEIYGCPVNRTTYQLRPHRWYLVRRLVGQTQCRLATGKTISPGTPPTTRMPDRE